MSERLIDAVRIQLDENTGITVTQAHRLCDELEKAQQVVDGCRLFRREIKSALGAEGTDEACQAQMLGTLDDILAPLDGKG